MVVNAKVAVKLKLVNCFRGVFGWSNLNDYLNGGTRVEYKNKLKRIFFLLVKAFMIYTVIAHPLARWGVVALSFRILYLKLKLFDTYLLQAEHWITFKHQTLQNLQHRWRLKLINITYKPIHYRSHWATWSVFICLSQAQ